MTDQPDFGFDYPLLKELTEAHGVPGYEDRIRELVRREFDGHVDHVQSDAMGNVVGTIDGASDYEVVIAAHMDEIGFIVRHVTDDGFLQLDALGGWDPAVLKAQRVVVHTDDGDLTGVIGSVPPHTLTEEQKKKEPKVEDVFVDLGLPGEEANERVTVGDLVSMEQTTTVVGNTVTGKSLDDRVCLFAMLEAAKRIENPAVTIHFAATVQEEVGLRGAEALGVDLDPDLALALDVTVANDVPGFKPGDYVTTLGEGAGIKLKDGSVITNPKVNKRLRAVAAEHDIPSQPEILPAGGTDTGGLQNSSGAKPVGAISVPTRYLHTVAESAHYVDIEATIDLLTTFLTTETGQHDYSL
ncbi:M42 family metallopeptidase [Haladaptatus sp. CMSO5]|uniref:M42 family metallopeptidase n=1 Tax=Haladaptatus sp. CMSO5 TaxID=3120514 RepID=UPI002FCE595D